MSSNFSYFLLILPSTLALAVFATTIDKNPITERYRIFEENSKEYPLKARELYFINNLKYLGKSDRERFNNLANNILYKIIELSGEDLLEVKLNINNDLYDIASSDYPNKIWLSDVCYKLFDNDHNMLAFILSHELAHLIHKHNIETIAMDCVSYAVFTAGIPFCLLLKFLPLALRLMVSFGFSFIVSKNLTNYVSRIKEFEADNSALYLMFLAGYSPESAKRCLEIAEIWKNELSKELRRSSQDPKDYYNYLSKPMEFVLGSTHPNFRARVDNISNQLEHISEMKEFSKSSPNYKWPSLKECEYLNFHEINRNLFDNDFIVHLNVY